MMMIMMMIRKAEIFCSTLTLCMYKLKRKLKPDNYYIIWTLFLS